MGIRKSVIETVNVPKFKEGRYTFPESIATLQPQRVEGDELLYDGYLTEAGKTTGKVFFKSSFGNFFEQINTENQQQIHS